VNEMLSGHVTGYVWERGILSGNCMWMLVLQPKTDCCASDYQTFCFLLEIWSHFKPEML